jgi:hypothetical protein
MRVRHIPSAGTAAGGTLLVIAALGVRAVAQLPHPIDLGEVGTDLVPGLRLVGEETGDRLGVSLSGSGDFNGDGCEELLIGASFAGLAGESYLIFGTADQAGVGGILEVDQLTGQNGVQIQGIGAISGFSTSGAGDTNGDGLADLLIGDPGALSRDEPLRITGEAYIVRGSNAGLGVAGTFDLADLRGENGVALVGGDQGSNTGRAVSGVGDVDADGFGDVLVGAPLSRSGLGAGASYLVLGTPDEMGQGGEFDLSTLSGEQGARIDGFFQGDSSGFSVSGAGDVDGDGLDDVLIRTPLRTVAGEVTLVFGSTLRDGSRDMLSLRDLSSSEAVRLVGLDLSDDRGASISGVGDVDADGFDDILISAVRNAVAADALLVFGSGSGFGPANVVALDQIASPEGVVFRDPSQILGPRTHASGAGDFDGDGHCDLLIGAPEGLGAEGKGQAFMVFGSPQLRASGSFDLNSLNGTNGVLFNGAEMSEQAGASVSGAGDFNGDGFSDVLIGATQESFSPRGLPSGPGKAYLIFGSGTATEATYRNWMIPGNAPRRGVGMIGDGSHSIPFSRCWIDYDGGNGFGNRGASLDTVTLIRSGASIRNIGSPTSAKANVLWEITSDRVAWSEAEITVKYLDSEIPLLIEDSLLLMQAPTVEGPWVVARDVARDTDRNQVSGKVSELGFFALGGVRDPTAPSSGDIVDYLLGITTDPSGLDVNGDDGIDSADVILSVNIGGEG